MVQGYAHDLIAHPGQIRRLGSFSGPIVGGLCCASMGPFDFTAPAGREFQLTLPYDARVVAIGWYAELDPTGADAATVGTLGANLRVGPAGTSGQVGVIFDASTEAASTIDIAANPIGTIYLNNTTLTVAPDQYIEGPNVHNSTGDLDWLSDTGTFYMRAGLTSLTGTVINMTFQVYYWPTDHAYTDKGDD